MNTLEEYLKAFEDAINGKKKVSQYRLSIQKLYEKEDFNYEELVENYTPNDELYIEE